MSRLRAWARVVDSALLPLGDAFMWLQARWYRVLALAVIEVVVFGLLIWSPW